MSLIRFSARVFVSVWFAACCWRGGDEPRHTQGSHLPAPGILFVYKQKYEILKVAWNKNKQINKNDLYLFGCVSWRALSCSFKSWLQKVNKGTFEVPFFRFFEKYFKSFLLVFNFMLHRIQIRVSKMLQYLQYLFPIVRIRITLIRSFEQCLLLYSRCSSSQPSYPPSRCQPSPNLSSPGIQTWVFSACLIFILGWWCKF